MKTPADLTTQLVASGIEAATSYFSGKLTSATEGQTEKQDPIAALQKLIDQELITALKPLFKQVNFELEPYPVTSRSGVRRDVVIVKNGGSSYIISVHKCILEVWTEETWPPFGGLSYLFSKNSKIWIISRGLDATDVGFDSILEEWKETKGIEAVFIPWKKVARVLQEKDGGQQFLLFTQVFKPEAASTRTETPPVAAKQPSSANGVPRPPSLRTIRIFLASSKELLEDRDKFELYILKQNHELLKKGFELKVERWEDFFSAMSKTRSQDEYNKVIRECDVFVSLFSTKAGEYTEEEFDVAHRQFESSGKPLIYTFFKDTEFTTGTAPKEDLKSLWAFQEKLEKLKHFYDKYDNIKDLNFQFGGQLDEILEKFG